MVNPIDVRNDGAISTDDWNTWRTNSGATRDTIVEIDGLNGGKTYAPFGDIEAALSGNGGAFSANGGAPSPTEARLKLMDKILRQMQGTPGGSKPENAEELKNQLKHQIMLAQREGIAAQNLNRFMRSAGMEGSAGAAKAMSAGDSQAQMQMQAPGTPMGGTGPAAQTTGGSGQTAPAVFPPAGWGAQTAMPQFSSSAYMQAQVVSDSVMSSWDSINQNTNRGKQLMMLFFYFARMAESGDMGAMYQFMKFITYIISKDKAKQQIEMGKKLIELQDMSRQWTNKLLNLSSNSNDPNASNELMKQMTIVKSETDAIATSQKLISQMMEEFAQVVETLTNTTKSALETAGRISRTVSTMR